MSRHTSWLRVLIESVAIISSILVAFAIDAWWEGQQEATQRRRVISAFAAELRNSSERLATLEQLHADQLGRVVVLSQVVAERPAVIAQDSLDHLLAGLLRTTTSAQERGALEAAQRSLAAIDNLSIRERLAEWERGLDQLESLESIESKLMSEQWLPFMRARTDMGQLSNVARERLGDWTPGEIPRPSHVDHRSILGEAEFGNMLVERQWIHEDILHELTSLQAFLRGFLMQVDS